MIGALIMGALVGWIAGKLMGVEGGLLRNIVIGVVGSFVGSGLFSLLGFYATDFWRRFSPVWWAPACSFGWDADCCTEWEISKKKGGPNGPPFFAVTAFSKVRSGSPEGPVKNQFSRPPKRPGTTRFSGVRNVSTPAERRSAAAASTSST